MTHCPVCGGQLSDENHLDTLATLSPQEYRLFDFVTSRKGRVVDTYDIVDYVWDGREEPEHPKRIISLIVHHINQKFGYKVIRGRAGGEGGYFLTKDKKLTNQENMTFAEAMMFLVESGGRAIVKRKGLTFTVKFGRKAGYLYDLPVDVRNRAYQPSPADIAASDWHIYN